MSDLKIHILEGVTEQDINIMNSTMISHYNEELAKLKTKELVFKVAKTPSVKIGSWREVVSEILDDLWEINDFATIDQELINRVYKIFNNEYINKRDEVISFLKNNIGKKIFLINW